MEVTLPNRMYVARPIEWTDRGVVILDQRRLPAEEISHTYTDYREVARAIREMVIRGAPAIHAARRPSDDAMQCGRAGHGGHWHGTGRDSRRRGAGKKAACAGAGNTALSARGAPYRMGAASRRDPADADYRQHGWAFPENGESRGHCHRSRPHRRQRRYREQDWHLPDRRPGQGK